MKTLIVSIPVDENYDRILELMSYASYKKEFWRGFAPPHRVVYKISHLSDVGVENWKEKFSELFFDSNYKGYCTFEVVDETEKEG